LQSVEHRLEKEPDWFWKIKPVTTKEELALAQFLSTERMLLLSDGTRIGRRVTNIETAIREIALTFGGTNIVDGDGKLILEANATVEQIEKVLLDMPNELTNELWIAVGSAIPTWGPVQTKN